MLYKPHIELFIIFFFSVCVIDRHRLAFLFFSFGAEWVAHVMATFLLTKCTHFTFFIVLPSCALFFKVCRTLVARNQHWIHLMNTFRFQNTVGFCFLLHCRLNENDKPSFMKSIPSWKCYLHNDISYVMDAWKYTLQLWWIYSESQFRMRHFKMK